MVFLIVVTLIAAALLSSALNDHSDGVIVLMIVLIGGRLGFAQQRDAAQAMEAWLRAADGVPADCRLLAACDVFFNDATPTCES